MKVNSIANCFELKAKDQEKVSDWKHWYDDVSMIGRHYLIYSKKRITIKRQYTICNTVVPKVYQALVELC